MVLAGAVLVVNGLSRLFSQEIHRAQNNQDADWQLFALQMRDELVAAKIEEKTSQDQLFLRKGEQGLRFEKSPKTSDFRKSAEDGRGHQVMLSGIQSVQIEKLPKELKIHFQFEKGGKKTFYYQEPS